MNMHGVELEQVKEHGYCALTSPIMSASSSVKLSPSRDALTSSLSSLRGTPRVSMVLELSPVVAKIRGYCEVLPALELPLAK